MSSSSYPGWLGPSENGSENIVYNYVGSSIFNPALGEKLARISRSSDTKGLDIKSVRRTDNGTYQCVAPAVAPVFIHLIVRVPPKNVTILNAEVLPSERIVIKGTEDVELALECLSVEVYPVASLNWYRDNDNTSTLIKNFESTIYDHSSNTYNISALARIVPSARDDNISYTCLSSFPDEPKLLTSTSAKLYLDLKPSLPTISLLDTPKEGDNLSATCQTSGFRSAESFHLPWSFRGSTSIYTGLPTEDMGSGKFSASTGYQRHVTRADNGQILTCTVDHKTLKTPLTGSVTVRVLFPSLSTSITGNNNIIANGLNRLNHTCTSGTSNPVSNVSWNVNDFNTVHTGISTELPGDFDGKLKQQQLVLIPIRDNDGDKVTCEAQSGGVVAASSIFLNLRYKPLVDAMPDLTVIEGNYSLLECSASSNPPSTFRWFREGHPAVLSQGIGNVNSNRLVYNITVVGRNDAATYRCNADNGIETSDNRNVKLIVHSFPILIKPIIDTNATERTSAKLHSYAKVNVEFNTEIRCYRNLNGTSEVEHMCTATQAESAVPLSVFEHIVPTKGVTENIEINTEDDFGLYDIVIINDIGSVAVKLEVLLEGAPWRPENIQLDELQQTAIRISWIPGYNGGFSQTFVIQLSTDQNNWFNGTTVDENRLRRLSLSITGLQESKTYFLRIFAYNVLGRSNFSDMYFFTTLANDKADTSSSVGALVGGIIGTSKMVAKKPVSEAEMPVFQDFQNTTGPATYEQLGTSNVASESHAYSTCTVEYNRAHGNESFSPYETLGQKAYVAYSSLSKDLEQIESTKANYENTTGQKEKICNYENTAEHQEKRDICKK